MCVTINPRVGTSRASRFPGHDVSITQASSEHSRQVSFPVRRYRRSEYQNSFSLSRTSWIAPGTDISADAASRTKSSYLCGAGFIRLDRRTAVLQAGSAFRTCLGIHDIPVTFDPEPFVHDNAGLFGDDDLDAGFFLGFPESSKKIGQIIRIE